jgi:hypothetical protein
MYFLFCFDILGLFCHSGINTTNKRCHCRLFSGIMISPKFLFFLYCLLTRSARCHESVRRSLVLYWARVLKVQCSNQTAYSKGFLDFFLGNRPADVVSRTNASSTSRKCKQREANVTRSFSSCVTMGWMARTFDGASRVVVPVVPFR